MAIEDKNKNFIDKFLPKFIRHKLFLVIISQILITSILFLALLKTNIFLANSINLWIITGGLIIINIFTNIIIVLLSVQPIKTLLTAVLDTSNKDNLSELSNPNSEDNVKSGLCYALQAIYELPNIKVTDEKFESNIKNLNEKINLLKHALDMSNCGFAIINKSQQIIYTNKAAPILIDDSGKKNFSLLFNGNDTLENWIADCIENSVHAEHTWTRIPDRLPNEENRRFFDVIAIYEKGSVAETVVTMIDRTNTYSTSEEDLDFISFAAHELRGPITVIKGYVDILEDELKDTLHGDQVELFKRLAVSSNRLSGYIDNILNTSRYDRRHLKMHLTESSVAEVYAIIEDDMKLRASSQNRILTVDLPSDLPTIAADSASLSEVFGNLIDNAIKYSNEGGTVNVTAKVDGDFVDISIQDHGIGMPESVISQLFQKFYRSHRSRETVAGTGIGLYISKAIVESHGGTISVRSQDGYGSTFTVSIPIYSTVADKLKTGDNSNETLINKDKSCINNHSMFRG